MVHDVAISDWNSFDVFELEKRTGGRSLRCVFHALLDESELLELVDTPRLESFLEELERLYTVSGNPYHTSMHAADVVATVATMMKLDARSFTAFHDWELLSLVIACAGHDVGHQGVTNAYHARLKTEWYMLYASGENESKSVNSINELAHADITLSLLRQDRFDFLSNMEAERKEKVLEYIEKMILQTDITWHSDVCDRFASACRKSSDEWTEADRVQILSGLLHFADVSNPGRPWKLCQRWAELLHDETVQEKEQLVLHAVPSCKGGADVAASHVGENGHAPTSVASTQVAFIKSTILPFCEQLSLVSPRFAQMVKPHLDESVKSWTALSQRES